MINDKIKLAGLKENIHEPMGGPGKYVEKIGKDYVFSYKPSPAIFAKDGWDIRSVKKNLISDFKKLGKFNTEIILKDISIVKYQPERLWQWAETMVEASKEYS